MRGIEPHTVARTRRFPGVIHRRLEFISIWRRAEVSIPIPRRYHLFSRQGCRPLQLTLQFRGQCWNRTNSVRFAVPLASTTELTKNKKGLNVSLSLFNMSYITLHHGLDQSRLSLNERKHIECSVSVFM